MTTLYDELQAAGCRSRYQDFLARDALVHAATLGTEDGVVL
jgi:hypothetical protein